MINNTYLPGAVILRGWLESKKITPHRFAINQRVDPSELNKVLRGLRKSVSIEFAAKIEDATGGTIPIRAWIPKGIEETE